MAESLTPFATLSRYPGFDEQPDAALVQRFEDFAAACIAHLRAKMAHDEPLQ